MLSRNSVFPSPISCFPWSKSFPHCTSEGPDGPVKLPWRVRFSGITLTFPFSLSELLETAPSDVNRFDKIPPLRDAPPFTLEWILRQGLYPAIHEMQIEVTDWMSSYYRTYVERYVRDTLAVGDLETFSRFIRFCAGRSGQILNLSSLGADAGVSHTTATPGWSRPYSSGAITPAARSTSSSISAGA